MAGIETKSFKDADEKRSFDHGQIEVINLADTTFGRSVFEPGWSWSGSVKPIVGTESCQVEHLGYIVSGNMKVRMNDGTETEMKAGDVMHVEPGHDAWIVGDEPCVMIDIQGATNYAKR